MKYYKAVFMVYDLVKDRDFIKENLCGYKTKRTSSCKWMHSTGISCSSDCMYGHDYLSWWIIGTNYLLRDLHNGKLVVLGEKIFYYKDEEFNQYFIEV